MASGVDHLVLLGSIDKIKGLTLSENRESCPFCGELADIAEGVFDVAGSTLSVITAPRVTKEMLAALGDAVRSAYETDKSAEELAAEVERIDPAFGDLVREAGGGKLFRTALLLILAAIATCDVDITLDLNELVDQVRGKPPNSLTSSDRDAE